MKVTKAGPATGIYPQNGGLVRNYLQKCHDHSGLARTVSVYLLNPNDLDYKYVFLYIYIYI